MDKAAFADLLAPVTAFVATLDLSNPAAAKQRLHDKFPLGSATLQAVREGLRAGIEAGTLCTRENDGVRFSRLQKPEGEGAWSIDLVHMNGPGPAHTHGQGEVDLCFAVEGRATFDGQPEGWTVYPPGSWHVPTVADGVMDIVYFLPGGAIEFGPQKP